MLVVLLMGLLAVAIGRAGRHTDRDGDHHALHGHGDPNPPGNFLTTVFFLNSQTEQILGCSISLFSQSRGSNIIRSYVIHPQSVTPVVHRTITQQTFLHKLNYPN